MAGVFAALDLQPAGEIVFAAYGTQAPAGREFSVHDSYADLDVGGKWVLAFRYLPEYIRPRDTADRINYEGTAKIARLMALLTRSVAMRERPPEYHETEKPLNKASRPNLRAYLGTIPEYAETGHKDVKLNGVAKGGPAAQAGLKRGDLIVEVAGRKIENIYDYT